MVQLLRDTQLQLKTLMADSVATTVKSSFSVSKILGFVVVGVIAFAILDLAGLTNWLLFPVTTAKKQFGKAPSVG